MQKQPPEGFFKKVVMRNVAEFTRKDMYQDPFLVFSCYFCKIYKNTFLQKSTGRLLLIIVVSIVAKRVLANETVNYKTKTKAHVLILASVQVIRKGSPGERAGFRSRRLQTSN